MFLVARLTTIGKNVVDGHKPVPPAVLQQWHNTFGEHKSSLARRFMQVAAAGTQLGLRGEAEHYSLLGDMFELQDLDGQEVVIFNRQALSRKNAQGGLYSKHEEETQTVYPNVFLPNLSLNYQVKMWRQETKDLVEEATNKEFRRLKRERCKGGTAATDEDLLKEAAALADSKVGAGR